VLISNPNSKSAENLPNWLDREKGVAVESSLSLSPLIFAPVLVFFFFRFFVFRSLPFLPFLKSVVVLRFWHRRWWFCCIDDGVRRLLVSDLVCWCFSFGVAGVGVVVTDLWPQICFQYVLVGDEFVVVSDLVLRWACWWRR
jgi:hypothetical protein